MPIPSSVPQTARATEEWEEAVSSTLETLNDGFGQYDPDELIMFRQTLDRHLVTAEQERDGLIGRAAPAVHLAGDSGSRSQATQVEVTLTQTGAEGAHSFFAEKAKRKD